MRFLNIKVGILSAVILGVTSGAFAKSSAAEKDTNWAMNNCVTYTEGKPIPWGRWNNAAGAECNAFDGDLSTKTGSGKTWAKLGLLVDFGESRTINEVSVHFSDGTHPTGYSILGSDDNTNWTVVKSVNTSSLVDSQTNVDATFRYIVVSFPLAGFDPWWAESVDEIGLWGKTEGAASSVKSGKVQLSRIKNQAHGIVSASTLTGRNINVNSNSTTSPGIYFRRPESIQK